MKPAQFDFGKSSLSVARIIGARLCEPQHHGILKTRGVSGGSCGSQIRALFFGVRRQSAAATALWICRNTGIQSGAALRLPPRSKICGSGALFCEPQHAGQPMSAMPTQCAPHAKLLRVTDPRSGQVASPPHTEAPLLNRRCTRASQTSGAFAESAE